MYNHYPSLKKNVNAIIVNEKKKLIKHYTSKEKNN